MMVYARRTRRAAALHAAPARLRRRSTASRNMRSTIYCVYLAERSITSGLVAVVFALLIVPNALFALGLPRAGRVAAPSCSARPWRWPGIGAAVRARTACRCRRAAPMSSSASAGRWSRVLFSSIANVMQASRAAKRGAGRVSLIAWGMVWGALFDAAVGAGASTGRRCSIRIRSIWAGIALSRADRLGARLHPAISA